MDQTPSNNRDFDTHFSTDDYENGSNFSQLHLSPPPMERSASSSTIKFRDNYDALLKEVLEENSEDDDSEELLSNIDIDVDAATADLPDELRAALEDRSLADKYLANLKTFMSSHRRTQSLGSTTTSAKGDYSSPNTPLQPTFSHHRPLSPKPFFRVQHDPLSKILDAVPYQNRLVNGVQSLTVLEQKFHALRIPELDLPTISDTIIRARLDDLYKIQDELYIHLHGGPLVRNTHSIGEKKRRKIMNLLDEIAKEIGLYEEFVKRAHYLSLESILNESDESSDEYIGDNEVFGTGSSQHDFDSSSDMSRATSGTPASPAAFSPTGASSKTPRRIASSSALSAASEQHDKLANGALLPTQLESLGAADRDGSVHSSDAGTDQSPSLSLLLSDDNHSQKDEGKETVEPWEAFKWTPLKKISDELYSEDVRRQSGLASVLAVSGVIAIGTTRSLVFVYDYSQNLKCILGDSARAIEIGSVTSLAISADHTTIACGHSQGYIVVWDITKPAQPIRIINPIAAHQATGSISVPTPQQHQNSRKEGHVKGAAILHINFVGIKKSEIVSADDHGMAFYHVLYKVMMVNAVDTTRILGRYHNLLLPSVEVSMSTLQNAGASPLVDGRLSVPPKPRKPSTVFAMQTLPLGQMAHPAENFGLVALLTPYKMVIVGLKPTPQTLYKVLKRKASNVSSVAVQSDALEQNIETQQKDDQYTSKPVESLAGCLAWLPVTGARGEKLATKDKSTKTVAPQSDPMLAFSWGNHLFILQVGIENVDKASNGSRGSRATTVNSKSKRGGKLEFMKHGEYKCKDTIVGLQWINKQILVLITPNEEMILFDPRNMVETERTSIRNKQLVYHDRFNAPLEPLVNETTAFTDQPGLARIDGPSTVKVVEMAYYHSLRGYKGKLFLLGLNKLYIGALLSWADRIIALVRAGDFLEGIELATLFYDGKHTQTVVGLPEDEQTRKFIVGEKLMELLMASLNYAFSSTRTYNGMADSLSGDGTILYRDLAVGCIKACLSMDNLDFLFDVVYDKFAESEVPGVFLEVLEPYILKDQVSNIPPAVMKDLVEHYGKKRKLAQLEQIIWHVNPQSLDIDQIVSMCHREGLYEAMMYVWNRSMNDYVSPVVEMLKVVRSVLKEETGNIRLTVPDRFYQSGERSRTTSTASSKTVEPATSLRHNAEKIFDYLKCILTGRTFPDGQSMPASRANEARSAVYAFVFSGRCVVWPKVGGKLVLTADDEDGTSEPTYPYLRLLLRFNTKKFLEALEIAFDDPWLNGGEDILTSTVEEELQGKVISRQIIVNTLLDVMGGGGGMSGSELPLPPPRPKQSISASTVHSMSNYGSTPTNNTIRDSESDPIVQLYIFIASNLHKYTTFILLPPTTLHKILVRLSEEHDPDTREERQSAVQNLLTVYTPSNEEQMVLYYEDAGFWRVLEDVYQRDNKYGKLVEAYLKDDERHDMVFDCVHRLLDERSGLSDKKRNEVKSVFMIRLSQFVEIDGQKTASVVENFFGGKHEEAIRRLEEDQEFDDDEYHDTADKRVFLYLRGLLEPFNDMDDEANKGSKPSAVYSNHAIPRVPASIHERYIELMCRFDPSGVYNYLNTSLDDSVNLNTVLESCEKHGVMDAVVWIMEKAGDTQGALDKMLSLAKEKVNTILRIIRDHQQGDREQQQERAWTFEEQGSVSSCLIGLSGVLRVGTRLCENSSRSGSSIYSDDGKTGGNEDGSSAGTEPDTHRSNNGVIETTAAVHSDLEADEIESLWFRLLDAYVESSIEVYNVLGASSESEVPRGLRQHIISSFKTFVQSILTSLLLSTSPQVSLPRLLLRLIHSQTRGETTFADFRDIFRSMLDTYKYEGKLLEMTNRLFDRDLFNGVQEMVREKGRGWRPRRGLCDICGGIVLDQTLLHKPLAWDFEEEQDANMDHKAAKDEKKDVIVYHCGHVFHRPCMESQLKDDPSEWRCVTCHRGQESRPKDTVAAQKKESKGKERAT